MKTILVVYNDTLLTTKKQIAKLKHYAFNTESEVVLNERIQANDYDTAMQVIKVLDKAFKYFNMSTGEMSDEYTSTSQREIRDMIITEPFGDDVIVATKIQTI